MTPILAPGRRRRKCRVSHTLTLRSVHINTHTQTHTHFKKQVLTTRPEQTKTPTTTTRPQHTWQDSAHFVLVSCVCWKTNNGSRHLRVQKRQAFTRCLSGKVTRSMFQHSHLPISWQRDEVRKCKKKESTEKKQKNVQEIEKAFVQSWHLNQHGVKRKEQRRRKETQERRGGRMKKIFFKKTQVKKTKTLLLCFFVSQLAAHPPGAFRSPCCEPNRWFKNQHAGSFESSYWVSSASQQ